MVVAVRERSWWVGVEGFRVMSLAYALIAFILDGDAFPYRDRAYAVLVVMCVWTAVAWSTVPRGKAPRRGARFLVVDLGVAIAITLSYLITDDVSRLSAGGSTIALTWAAAPVLAWAVAGGWKGGTVSAAALSVANIVVTWVPGRGTWSSLALLFIAGAIVGFSVERVRLTNEALAAAEARAAVARDRAMLAAEIHDSVLQALAFIARRGKEIGGESVELSRLAGEQEAVLRDLMAVPGARAGGVVEAADLMEAIRTVGRGRAEVSGPEVVDGVCPDVVVAVHDAVRAALENVAKHAGQGASAWVFVDDDPDGVVVSVRDDGVGCAPGRFDASKREGRMGASHSIVGRLRAVGGDAVVTCAEGGGVEWELKLPKRCEGADHDNG